MVSRQIDLVGHTTCLPNQTGGGKASKKGKLYEKSVECILKQLQIPYESQVKYTGFQMGEKYIDFVAKTLKKYPLGLGIEVRTQITGGSADEKNSDFVRNILMNPVPTIVVCYLVGAKKESVTWLYEQVDGEKFVGCFDIGEFINWIHDQVYENG